MFAFLSHHDIFHRQFFEICFLFLHLLFQAAVLVAQPVDDIQFPPYEAFRRRAFYVVPAVDGEEEIVQEGIEVPLVECFCGIGVFLVRLALPERCRYDVVVVVVSGKLYHLAPDEHLVAAERLFEGDAFQTCTA